MTDQDNKLDFAFRMLDYDNPKSYQARKTAYETQKAELPPAEEQEKLRTEYKERKDSYRQNLLGNAKKHNYTHCPLCGQKVEPEEKVCFFCDKNLVRAYQEETQNNEENKKIFEENTIKASKYKKFAIIFLVFSAVCFFTALYLDWNINSVGSAYITNSVTTLGPINIADDNTVLFIKVLETDDNNAVFVSGDILDTKQNILFQFSKDLWSESGYESGYSWRESDDKYETRINFSKKGDYYITLETEPELPGQNVNLLIEINKKRASAFIPFWFGLLSIIASGVFYTLYKIKQWIAEREDPFLKIFKIIGYTILGLICIWAETL